MNKKHSLIPLRDGSASIYADILTALVPVLAWAIYLYSLRPLVLLTTGIITALTVDIIFDIMRKKDIKFDISSVVCASLTALLLPPVAPLWLPVLACGISAGIKNAFSILKRHIISPSALSLAICHLCLYDVMTASAETGQKISAFVPTVKDYVLSGMSALDISLNGILPETSIAKLFFGFRAGMIGEMSAFILVLGLIYLALRKAVKLYAPIAYTLCLGALVYIFPTITGVSEDIAFRGVLFNLFGSSTLFCIIYFSAEPGSSPKTAKSGIISGALAACVTVAVRYYISTELSAIAGVLVMNISAFVIDSYFPPMPFGGKLKAK